MRIYVVDDEPIALKRSLKIIQEIIQEVEPGADVRGFGRAKAVFKQITENNESPDVVFSDIEMPGMSGLEFAVKLKQLCPHTILIFVTAYSQYALDAFRLHVHGYILKPLTEDRVREELAYAMKEGRKNSDTNNSIEKNDPLDTNDSVDPVGLQEIKSRSKRNRDEKMQVQCFGAFEVFWKGMPLMFSRGQTKELFAYLIDRKGNSCREEEIAGVLWPEEENVNERKSRIRILISDLKRILGSINRENLIIRRGGQIAVLKEEIDCDYYRMLAGDMDAVNAYQGEYMAQYSWAEMDLQT